MKRLRGRTILTVLLTLAFAAGVLLFCVRLVRHGGDWVGFFGTTYYRSGVISDTNGTMLYDGQNAAYSDEWATRVSTLHLVGDRSFGTSLRSALAGRLTGYNPVTGTAFGSHDITLTIDSGLNRTAYAAMNGHKGTVAVYNYKTGDVLCMVSAPAYDPNNPPADVNENSAYDGVYVNRFFSATYSPGSTFKLVTTAAAIEKKRDLSDFRYTCTGSLAIGDDIVTCPYVHGADMDINQCLACSCNGAYATLALELGGKTLQNYMKEAGLLSSRTISGITTASGSFTVGDRGSISLGWSGVGQYEDLVNPCAMLTFVGGIANGGTAVVPRFVQKEVISGTDVPAALPDGRESFSIYSEATCARLKDMMRNNVLSQYGQDQFGWLPVCAKSGTAEVGGGRDPHSWFVGFVDDESCPLAFVVLVENGGSGASVAGSIAAQLLLQAAG